MACENCRSRKAKCDLKQPRCSHCEKTGRTCEYVPAKKRGPNKKSIRKLEERLALLEQSNVVRQAQVASPPHSSESNPSPNDVPYVPDQLSNGFEPTSFSNDFSQDVPMAGGGMASDSIDLFSEFLLPGFDFNNFQLGTEDFLLDPAAQRPSQELAKALEDCYFNLIHQNVPMLHKGRFYARNPPMALRYAIWAIGAVMSAEHRHVANSMYRSAREQLEADELKGLGESYLSCSHAQSWTLIAFFETIHHSFIRAWMSARRAVGLCQILGLDRIDQADAPRAVVSILPPAEDYIELEERRRTFWAAFGSDRWSGGGNGWGMSINADSIATNLPGPEENFERGEEVQSKSLYAMIEDGFDDNTPVWAAANVMTFWVGRISQYMSNSPRNVDDKDEEAAVWREHRRIDHQLTKLSMNVPRHLSAANNLSNPWVVHMNVMIHGCILSLQHATMCKFFKKSTEPGLMGPFMTRIYHSAEEILGMVRPIAHFPATLLQPFTALPIYMAARGLINSDDEMWTYQRTHANIDFAMACLYKIAKSHNIVFHIFARARNDLAQSRFNDLLIPKYRDAKREIGDGQFNTDADPSARAVEPPLASGPWHPMMAAEHDHWPNGLDKETVDREPMAPSMANWIGFHQSRAGAAGAGRSAP